MTQFAPSSKVRVISFSSSVLISNIVLGTSLSEGDTTTTIDAFHGENGKQVIATQEEVDAVIEHIKNYVSPKKVFINEIRAVEDEILSTANAAVLVGNQLIDFGKQVGCLCYLERLF